MVKWARPVVALGSIVLVLGMIAGVVNRQVLDGGRFAEHVDAVRTDPQVSRQVGLVVTDRLLVEAPNLVGLRPLIESASATLVASPSLGPAVRSTIAPLHQALTSSNNQQVVLRLADVGALLVAAISALAPNTSVPIPRGLDVTLASIGSQDASRTIIDTAHTVGVLAGVLPLLALGLFLLAGMISARDWRSRGRVVSSGVLLASGLMMLLLVLIDLAASRLDATTLGGALGRGAWNELDRSFWIMAALVGVLGFVGRAVTTPGFSLDLSSMAQRSWAAVTEPAVSAGAEALRAAVIMGVGALLVLRPTIVLALAVAGLGVLVLLSGIRTLGTALATLWSERWDDQETRAEHLDRLRSRARPVAIVAAAVAVLAVILPGAWPTDHDLELVSKVDDTTCNGHVELCDRRYDEVSFPATHNSMSAADQPGWFLAEQPFGILRQLDDGIRVLLIDSWDGQQSQRPGIVANTEESRAKALAEAEATYGESLVKSALRVRDSLRLTPTGQESEPYLCHALCELGATRWEPLMVEFRAWLDAHPREVVTFFIQDEVSARDTADLVERAGLMPYVHQPKPGEPWPTLDEMLASGQRVVFLLENSSGGAAHPWLIDARTEVQDTPYAFTKVSQFSCEPFRGSRDAPLFLVNHWLSNYQSRVTDGRVVNAESVLLPRLEQCRAERDRVPNFVAVNNYDQGDLVATVDKLNGLS